MTSTRPVLQLHGITKRFGPLLANDGISLDLARGEVLALLGENGAGKSTLVSILFGHYVADAGQVRVDGQVLAPGQPRAALAAGIGMVHQHFTLADNLSVLDNVMLGCESLLQPFSRRAAARQRLLEEAARFGLQVAPDARVADLSVGERQRVEILKALLPFGRKRGARILILDEPTAVLTPQESERLFATLALMVADRTHGLAIVFISHKLDEVLRVSHRVAVLRAGRLVATLPAAGASKAGLAALMVGRTVEPAVRQRRAAVGSTPLLSPAPAPAPLLTLHDVRIGDSRATAAQRLRVPALAVHAGEIVAVAGVAGNGQALLAALLCGERAPDAGQLLIDGRALPARPRAFVQAGVARVPEDRQHVGLIGDLALWENALLERYRDPPFARRGGWLNRGAAMAFARSIVQRLDIRGAAAEGVLTPARRLSGGNLQKLILGRVLLRPRMAATTGTATATAEAAMADTAPPPLIVASQPTWGLDVGAVAAVHQQLLDAAAAGSAVLVISEDLDEVFAIADRIAVIHQGDLGPALPCAHWTLARIGLAMAGSTADAADHAIPADRAEPTDAAA